MQQCARFLFYPVRKTMISCIYVTLNAGEQAEKMAVFMQQCARMRLFYLKDFGKNGLLWGNSMHICDLFLILVLLFSCINMTLNADGPAGKAGCFYQ